VQASYRSRIKRRVQLFEVEAGEHEYNLCVRFAGLRDDHTNDRVAVRPAMGRLLRKAITALVMQEERQKEK
jgi:hypothetical protein